MKIYVMSCFWGDKHLEMWKKACLKSLSMRSNKKSLYENDITLCVFTDDKYFDHIMKHVDAFLPEIKIKLRSKTDLRSYIDPVQAAAILMMEECIKDGARLLMAPPDTIFGDGSLNGLFKVGRESGTCVVAPHPRVLPNILNESFTPYVTNSELVKLTFSRSEAGDYKYLHRSWSEAEVGCERQNSFVGGVCWQKVDDHIYEVKHRLPTVYLADFLPEDLAYFKAQISFGGWDHTWPGDILVPKGRQRFIGSSDLAFMIEITEGDKNVPPIWPGDIDDFWRHHFHNEMNKQISSVFRSG